MRFNPKAPIGNKKAVRTSNDDENPIDNHLDTGPRDQMFGHVRQSCCPNRRHRAVGIELPLIPRANLVTRGRGRCADGRCMELRDVGTIRLAQAIGTAINALARETRTLMRTAKS